MKTPKIVVANVRFGLLPNIDLHLYCGRSATPQGMINAELGNPFRMSQESERQHVIKCYEAWLVHDRPGNTWKRIARISERLKEGKSIALYCHCAPRACHCDIIRREALAMTNE